MTLNRSKQPAIQPITSLELLDAEREQLSNGTTLYCLPGGDQPVLNLQLVVPAGRWQEEKPLQALLTSLLFTEGSKKKTAKDIHEQIDFYGARLSVKPTYDYAVVQLTTLRKHLSPLLDLLVELLNEPQVDENELLIKRNNLIEQLQINEQKTNYLAQRLFHNKLFGEHHPYGYASSKEKYQAITVEDVMAFQRNQYRIQRGFALLAGAIDQPSKQLVIDALNSIKTAHRAGKEHVKQAQTEAGRYEHRKPNAKQASIRIGQLIVTNEHPDFQGLQVLNAVLGGYFGSRLMSNLREKKGLTYGVYSVANSLLHQGYFYVATEVKVNQVEEAIAEIYGEINQLREQPIPTDELQLVKNYMMGKYLSKIDGPFAQAKLFRSLISRSESAQEFTDRVQSIQAITASDLQQLANKYWTPQQMVEVIV